MSPLDLRQSYRTVKKFRLGGRRSEVGGRVGGRRSEVGGRLGGRCMVGVVGGCGSDAVHCRLC